ncbi:MAG: TIGR03808 family TAT-translocated repetitive protein [Fimbriimonadaceae bacterium]|nr:TIGR03808 family TAT-translocated repetitive protein [Alphaproteobacteria bacterium]
MSLNRRSFLSLGATGLGTAGLGAGTAGIGLIAPQSAAHAAISPSTGALDVSQYGVNPGRPGDQSTELQNAINDSAHLGMPLFLPPGRYMVSGIELPDNTMVTGVPGQTRLIFSGGTTMLRARGARRVTLTNLAIGGAGNQLIGDTAGLVHLEDVSDAEIVNCMIVGSSENGLSLYGVSGVVRDCEISHAAKTGLFANDSRGLEISANKVHDCADNGIQVWRSTKGDDATFVTNNRISNIAATSGGSGQYGNGINIFRAGSVMVSNNRITDCAYSAVRSNAGSNCQIIANSCARFGEVALYAEFGFEGAIMANNLVEKAAAGISITNFNEGGRLAVCTGNIIRNLSGRTGPDEPDVRGFGIGVEADTVVNANVIEDAPLAGITLGWGEHLRNVTVTSNIVRNSEIGVRVSVAPGAGNAIISENMISGVSNGAVRATRWHDIVPGDLTKVGSADYPQLTVERNQVS